MEGKKIEELYDIKIAMSMDEEGNPEILTIVQKTNTVDALAEQFSEYGAVEEMLISGISESVIDYTKNLLVLEE